MNKDKLNQIIHERLFKGCWHEPDMGYHNIHNDNPRKCGKPGCKFEVPSHFSWSVLHYNPDYTKSEMFMTVWEEVKGEDWFKMFILVNYYAPPHDNLDDDDYDGHIPIDLINSKRLCELIIEFKGWR